MKLQHNCSTNTAIVKRQLRFFCYKFNKSKKITSKETYAKLIKDFKQLLNCINKNYNYRNNNSTKMKH